MDEDLDELTAATLETLKQGTRIAAINAAANFCAHRATGGGFYSAEAVVEIARSFELYIKYG